MPAVRKPLNAVRIVARDDAKHAGCAWCPLAPFCDDFATALPGAMYQRDAAKIRAASKDDHHITTRMVEEKTWDKVDILFIGEAPGQDEDRKGEPFVGKSGQLLWQSLQDGLGTYDYSVGFANVVSCRPPRNRDPSKVEIQACSPRLLEQIRVREPKLLVALGNVPLEFLTGDTGVLALAGKVLKTRRSDMPDMDVLVCHHPAYILRQDTERPKFDKIIASCHQILSGTQVKMRGLGTYRIIEDVAELRAFRDRVKKERKTNALSVDTETGSLDFWRTEHPQLLCLSFSNGHEEGLTVPFDHADSPFRVGGSKQSQRAEVIAILVELLTVIEVERTGQNEKFDRKHIRKGVGVEPTPFNRDTYLMHLTQDERHGTHGLKTLAHQYTSCGGYEHELEDYIKAHPECDPEKGGSYANIPGYILFRYAAIDADMTWHVDVCLRNEPAYRDNPKLQVYAETFLPILSHALADMEYEGVQVDPQVVDELSRLWVDKIETARLRIYEDPQVQRFLSDNRAKFMAEAEANPKRARGLLRKAQDVAFNPGSYKQLGVVLWTYYGLRPTELTDTGLAILKQRHEAAGGRRALDFQDIVDKAIENKEWDFFTTNSEVMQDYDRFGNPLASAITEHRAESKLHTSFLVPLKDFQDPVGRVHTNFKMGGAQTGRLSSEDPNVQQIPSTKGGGQLKTPFVSRFGSEGVIVNIDYSQIELRVAAALYRDESMIQAYRDGADLHTVTATDIMTKMGKVYEDLDEAAQKKWRTGAKRTNFGIIYGAQAPTIKATCKKDGVFLTDDEAETIVRVFLEARPGLVAGMHAAEEFLMEHGYIDAPTGTRRRIPEALSANKTIRERALRQGVNFGVQCVAAQMTMMALCIIQRRMREAQTRSKLVLNVHDALAFDCHVDEFQAVSGTAKHVMEHLPELSDEVWPGLDWAWMDVPIVAECEIGFNYGKCVSFDPDALDGDPTAQEKPLIGLKKDRMTILRDPVNIDELWDAMTFKASH